MACGLTDEQAIVLHFLLRNRCMNEKNSKRLEAIDRQLHHSIPELEEVLRSLIRLGLIGCKKKKSVNYWINAGDAIPLLREHGYCIPLGNLHRLH